MVLPGHEPPPFANPLPLFDYKLSHITTAFRDVMVATVIALICGETILISDSYSDDGNRKFIPYVDRFCCCSLTFSLFLFRCVITLLLRLN